MRVRHARFCDDGIVILETTHVVFRVDGRTVVEHLC
jgi:hypothetical protein